MDVYCASRIFHPVLLHCNITHPIDYKEKVLSVGNKQAVRLKPKPD